MSCAVVKFFIDIAKKEDLQLRLIPSPLQTASDKINHYEIDVSAHGISNINTQAKPDYATASEPYLDVQRGFTVLKDSPFATLKKLPKGSKVAVMDEGTALQDLNHQYKGDLKLTIVSKLEGKARELLRQHKVDAIAEGYTSFWSIN
nr:transporter substrate-binding domain-containing protein [Parashewanella hymeniacidonis]